MKYRVRIEDHWYEVEVGDLHTRPITAIVEGERFEVWPEMDYANLVGAASSAGAASLAERKKHNPVSKPAAAQIPAARPPAAPQPVSARWDGKGSEIADNSALKAVRAPIPGVIVSLAIEPGATVATGQELCVLEAMKMKNSIRAARAGQIAAIHVTPGQAVKHRDVLMEFKD